MQKITFRKALASVVLSAATGFISVHSHAVSQAIEPLAPTRDQAITSIQVAAYLSQSHYLKKQINDEVSAQHLKNYLESLDGGKQVFTQADVNYFMQYRHELDDKVKLGDISLPFEIFNRYREKMQSLLEKQLQALPAKVKAFDFKRNESLLLDDESESWPKDQAAVDEIWRKRLKNSVLSLKIAGKEDDAIVELLEKRYNNQLQRLIELNSEDVYQLYVNALAKQFDPHTSYLSPAISENFNINMSLSLEGIGAVLQRDEEYTKVVRLVAAGPADKQGELQPADRILAVGQGESGDLIDVIGWRLDDVVKLIRGPKGSTVRLQILPAGQEDEARAKVIEIKRNTVKLEEQAAQKQIIEIPDGQGNKITLGVIDIPAFYIDFEALRRNDPDYRSTTRDVARLVSELSAENVAGIIIDLRENGGGSLREADELTGLFIDYGPTVQIKDAKQKVRRERQEPKASYYDGPLVVMINRLSASASEIFAGALQDYGRAVIVGSQSFGKGTVQSLARLRQGQLKLTQSKFYRISGESTQHRGVLPDIAFPAVYDKEEVGESALDGALAWDTIKPAFFRKFQDLDVLMPELQRRHQQRAQDIPEFQYWQNRLALIKKYAEINEISLNREQRELDKKEKDQALLNLENELRKAKGEPLLESLDDDENEKASNQAAASESGSKPDEIASEHMAETNKDEDPDAFLLEAGRILVDAIELQESQKIANKVAGRAH